MWHKSQKSLIIQRSYRFGQQLLIQLLPCHQHMKRLHMPIAHLDHPQLHLTDLAVFIEPFGEYAVVVAWRHPFAKVADFVPLLCYGFVLAVFDEERGAFLRAVGVEEEGAEHGVPSGRKRLDLELVKLGVELDKGIPEGLVSRIPDEVADNVAVFIADVARLLIRCADQHEHVRLHLPDAHQRYHAFHRPVLDLGCVFDAQHAVVALDPARPQVFAGQVEHPQLKHVLLPRFVPKYHGMIVPLPQ